MRTLVVVLYIDGDHIFTKPIVVAPWKWAEHGISGPILDDLQCGVVGNVSKVSTTDFSDSFSIDVFNSAIESKGNSFETQFARIISNKR